MKQLKRTVKKMSKYTLELWEVVDFGYNLFNFEYDFYDNDKKEKIQTNWFEHFKFYEIGSETIERFLDRMKTKWLEVVEKYSTMFEANERIKNQIDILSNYNTESQVVFNDTPKGEVVFDEKHMTNYTVSKTKGFMGTTGIQLLKDYNQNFIDIQEEFFKEFSNLFMQVY